MYKRQVAINEAVELTKKYGAGEDYQFVNGLLGAVAVSYTHLDVYKRQGMRTA